MFYKKKFPFLQQTDLTECGPACLRIISKHFGNEIHPAQLRKIIKTKHFGVRLSELADAAEKAGFKTLTCKIPWDTLSGQLPLPGIVHWKNTHFIVVYAVKGDVVYVSDPATGLKEYSKEEFLKGWADGTGEGFALLMEPTPRFYEDAYAPKTDDAPNTLSIRFFFRYLRPLKKFFAQLFIGMLVGSALQLIFPILTQAIVDYGITNQNISFVNLVLLAQLMLFFSKSAIDILRTWIFLHISNRLNITIISDFLNKLLRVRLSFFDNKIIGDLLQRISDHNRIQSFISSTSFSAIFSIFNLVVFSIILGFYNGKILLVFFIGSFLYFSWLILFLRQRKKLDNRMFKRNAKNQSLLIQLISGIRDIKLNNAEKEKRWEWERAQIESFKLTIRQTRLSQLQQNGALIIDQVKNIFISYLSAKAVIEGNISMGMMLSIQYIIGQLSAPISQIIGLFNSYQDAKISLERLSEIHNMEDEGNMSAGHAIPTDNNIEFRNVIFKYDDGAEPALKNASFTIPEGKVTAIVGMSGSGKTTILKLLLQFYELESGEIKIGGVNLENIDRKWWRDQCGNVLQDSFIFSDTVANNIAFGKEEIDISKLNKALEIANIKEFVDTLPLGYDARIGSEGHGISQGQKQRLLIARAIYKEPSFIFLDEATNSLDAKNEKIIVNNLTTFFEKRTVIIVAHRLSTITNADQIILVDKGEIREAGSHEALIAAGGMYYDLVRSQIDLKK